MAEVKNVSVQSEPETEFWIQFLLTQHTGECAGQNN